MEKEKEIGKLLKLLNDYENRDLELDWNEESNARTENNGHLRFNGANKVQFDTYMFDSLALSKKYGFIKWLVENEKIDLEKVEKKFYNEICITDYGDKDRAYGKSDLVISVLSISDTPIEFLVSILK